MNKKSAYHCIQCSSPISVKDHIEHRGLCEKCQNDRDMDLEAEMQIQWEAKEQRQKESYTQY